MSASVSSSADPRKGKPGQSCAECRRSVFYSPRVGPLGLFVRPTRNAQIETQM
jgi:hypothetical protein